MEVFCPYGATSRSTWEQHHNHRSQSERFFIVPTQTLTTDVRMIKGVGPQRAELLSKRGIHTLEDLLTYLPFRYEDRIHFSNVKDIRPNGIYTLRVQVMSGQAVRTMRGRDAIFHLLVQDATGH